jgi:alcohol dehydrogenase YqhD (iron-dependent ADH family)
VSFGVNVFGIDATLPKMDIAHKAIERLSDFFFKELGLQSTFTEVGVKREDFKEMARKACRYGDIKGFKRLTPEDVERIFEMCL